MYGATVHVCITKSWYKSLFPWCPPSPLTFILTHSLPQSSLGPEGRYFTDTSHLQMSVSSSASLYTLSDCGSSYLFWSTAGGKFSVDVWARHWPMSRDIVFLSSFSRIVVFGFPLHLWSVYSQVHGQQWSVRDFLSHGVVIKWKHILVGYCHKLGSIIAQTHFAGRSLL